MAGAAYSEPAAIWPPRSCGTVSLKRLVFADSQNRRIPRWEYVFRGARSANSFPGTRDPGPPLLFSSNPLQTHAYLSFLRILDTGRAARVNQTSLLAPRIIGFCVRRASDEISPFDSRISTSFSPDRSDYTASRGDSSRGDRSKGLEFAMDRLGS